MKTLAGDVLQKYSYESWLGDVKPGQRIGDRHCGPLGPRKLQLIALLKRGCEVLKTKV